MRRMLAIEIYRWPISDCNGKEAENMWPIATAPFYAFRISSGMLNTSGGIRINTNAQVVDDRYKPIAGLYAAGVCTSG